MKRILCVVLAIVMVFACLTACSKQNDDDNQNSGNTNNQGNNNETNNNEGNGNDDAVTIKLGHIGPLSGGNAVYGQATDRGAEIAVEEINALNGSIKFEFKSEDDESDAEKSVNAYNALKDWGMQVLVGTTTTSPCIAVSAETYSDRIFELTPSASSSKVTEGKDNVFQMCFTDPNQGIASADYIAENNLGEKIAIIYNNGDAYSTGIYEKFVAEATEKNLNVVYTGTFPSDDTADFSVQLTGAQSAGADLVFLPIYATPASLLLAQANSMGYSPKFFGVDGMDGILTLEGFNTKLAEGVMLLTPFSADATDDLTVNFVQKYQDAYGEVPNQFAADSYDCVYAIYYACIEAGITSDMSTSDICDALIATFTSSDFTFDGLTGDGVTWNTSGEVSKSPKAIVIENGKYVGMD